MSLQGKTELERVQSAVLVESEMPEDLKGAEVRGYTWDTKEVDYDALFKSYLTAGFQSTNLGRCIEEINDMLKWRQSDEEITEDTPLDERDPEKRKKTRTKIFFGYTSNLISSGLRETIVYLAKNKMIDYIVTTAGGIEEDFIKCLAPTYIGDFKLDGATLRDKGVNRIGNLLVPNNNYGKFDDWIMPILDQMVIEQQEGTVWSPSKMIKRFGKEINDERSVYYWCWKNDIPVFSPAITDGSIGDMIYMHTFRNFEGKNGVNLIVDIAQDIRKINQLAVFAPHTGMILLGGGLIKHHICNANLMRNGADHAVFINTAQEFDGSDAGARPDEAVSWGKIKSGAKSVKLYAEATLVFPIIVAQTFAKNWVPRDDLKK